MSPVRRWNCTCSRCNVSGVNHLEDDLDRYPIATGDDAGQVPVIDLSELRRDVGSPAARPAVDAIAVHIRSQRRRLRQ